MKNNQHMFDIALYFFIWYCYRLLWWITSSMISLIYMYSMYDATDVDVLLLMKKMMMLIRIIWTLVLWCFLWTHNIFKRGQTPLMVACKEGCIEVVQLLVEKYGANIDHQDEVMKSYYCHSSHHITCFACIFILRMDIHLPMWQLKRTISCGILRVKELISHWKLTYVLYCWLINILKRTFNSIFCH